jgi:hypothetical protein
MIFLVHVGLGRLLWAGFLICTFLAVAHDAWGWWL